MSRYSFCLPWLLVTVTLSSSVESDSIETASPLDLERSALIELGEATNVKTWVRNGNWLSNKSVCDWDLVGCDGDGRVKLLTLDFNNLTGGLPTSLGNLARLQDLDLEFNALTGVVPSSLGGLKSLVQLGLGHNQFSGLLPEELCSALIGVTQNGNLAMPGCDLSGNSYSCPLPCPELTALCNAKCDADGKVSDRPVLV